MILLLLIQYQLMLGLYFCYIIQTMRESKKPSIATLTIIVIIILLVILGIYKAIGTTSAQSRDARRISDVQTLYKALTLHQTMNSNFPISTTPITIDGKDLLSTALISSETLEGPVIDPLHPTYDYTYSTDEIGGDFTIQFCLEGKGIKEYRQGCNNYIKP